MKKMIIGIVFIVMLVIICYQIEQIAYYKTMSEGFKKAYVRAVEGK